MPLHAPISLLQFWTFSGSGLVFFVFLLRALSQRTPEPRAKRDRRSQLGIAIQSVGIGLAGFGSVNPTLAPLAPISLAATATVLVLMSGAIGLFVASSRELGRNWSLVARTRSDHELVRTGPYSRIRHPIYLGLLLFLLALAIALGHWAQLLIAVPVFFAGTAIRTRLKTVYSRRASETHSGITEVQLRRSFLGFSKAQAASPAPALSLAA